jgi:hypothetical protein
LFYKIEEQRVESKKGEREGRFLFIMPAEYEKLNLPFSLFTHYPIRSGIGFYRVS